MNLKHILDLNQQEALGGKNQNMDSLNDYLVEKRKLMICKLMHFKISIYFLNNAWNDRYILYLQKFLNN